MLNYRRGNLEVPDAMGGIVYMADKLILMVACLGFSSAAAAGTPGAVQDRVSFDRGAALSGFMAAAAEVGIPDAGRRPADIAAEFQTMGRHEGGRAGVSDALVSIETQVTANGKPNFVQLEIKYPKIAKDKEALAIDPNALTMTVNLPLKYYSAIFEGNQFLMTGWEVEGKDVSVYSSYDERTRFIQITQTTKNSSGGIRSVEVLKLTVAGEEISMGQLEKFKPDNDTPYFSEYIVMPEKVASGLALKNPATVGRISEPSLIRYVAESPTPERIREVLKR